MILIGVPAQAEEDLPVRRALMLPGNVVAGRTVTVQAPFGGQLEDFTVRAGDIVPPDAVLFEVATTKVYAPTGGTVGSLGAQVGDEAAYLQERYSAILYIEPRSQYVIKTDTKEAYSEDDNMLIRIGEKVYLGSRNSSSRVGEGIITAVDGSDFTVEVTSGNLSMDDNVAIYRSHDFKSRTKIGAGKTEKNPSVPITAEGSIYKLYVKQGDTVRRGDLLCEMVSGTTSYNPLPTNQVVAGYAAVVASVDVAQGATVTQHQVLATLYPVQDFQVAAPVLETDLPSLAVGDPVRVELLSAFDAAPVPGTIAAISGLSDEAAEEPEYTVYVSFEASDLVRPGMSVNVYINE